MYLFNKVLKWIASIHVLSCLHQSLAELDYPPLVTDRWSNFIPVICLLLYERIRLYAWYRDNWRILTAHAIKQSKEMSKDYVCIQPYSIPYSSFLLKWNQFKWALQPLPEHLPYTLLTDNRDTETHHRGPLPSTRRLHFLTETSTWARTNNGESLEMTLSVHNSQFHFRTIFWISIKSSSLADVAFHLLISLRTDNRMNDL